MTNKFLSAFCAAAMVTSLATGAGLANATESDVEFDLRSSSGSYLVGIFASKIRDTDTAAKFLSRALSDDPNNRSLIERAFVLSVSSGHIDRAEALAERIIRFNKRNRRARVVLGLREAGKGRFDSARKHFEIAAYTPIGELTATLLMAWTYAAQGKGTEAFSALDKLDKNDAFSNFKIVHSALIADFLNIPSRAEASYKMADEQVGSLMRVVQAYGNYLRRTGRNDQAIEVYQKYLDAGRTSPLVSVALEATKNGRPAEKFINSASDGMAEALFFIASALSDEQNIDLSLIFIQLALAVRPDMDIAQVLLGEVYEDTKRYQKAVETFRGVPKSSPLSENAEIQVAVNLDHLERTDDAIAQLRDFVARNPQSYDGYFTLGNIQRVHEKWLDAIKSYDQAIKLTDLKSPNLWLLHYYRGIAFERSKQWQPAEADFLKALELQPDQPAVLNYLGYSYIEKRVNLDKAMKMVAKAVDLRPNDGYIVDSLGWAHYQLGEYEDAVKHLERAVEIRPEDPVINDHLGDAYWRVGRKLEAKFQWQHAKDNKPEAKDLKIIEEKLLMGLPDLEEPTPSAGGADPSKS